MAVIAEFKSDKWCYAKQRNSKNTALTETGSIFVACNATYKSPCRSVRPSVGRSVTLWLLPLPNSTRQSSRVIGLVLKKVFFVHLAKNLIIFLELHHH